MEGDATDTNTSTHTRKYIIVILFEQGTEEWHSALL